MAYLYIFKYNLYMKQRILHKLTVICGIIASIFLSIDGCLIAVLQYNKSIKHFDTVNYRELARFTHIQNDFNPVRIYYNITPVVVLPSKSFETPQNTIWIQVLSSGKLQTGDFGSYSVKFKRKDEDSPFYSYYVNIDGIAVERKEFSLEFLDNKGDVIKKDISVLKKQVDILGVDDVKDEIIQSDGDSLLTVIDKEYGLAYDYEPADLVGIAEYDLLYINGEKKLRLEVMDDLQKMIEESKTLGYEFYITSGYRSYQNQIDLNNFIVQRDGIKFAAKSVARPGHSEHQLGTAIDFTSGDVINGRIKNFGSTPESTWLAENAYKYGFVLSYPKGSEESTGYKYEPWHYRYVGIQTAQEIYESGKIPIEYLKEVYFSEL